MKDVWYSDKRDLVKWGTLVRLAEARQATAILQVAYYRPNSWPTIEIDGIACELPETVTAHFRKITNANRISTRLQIIVFDSLWKDRGQYIQEVRQQIRDLPPNSVVFLDPDTGLAPVRRNGLQHVLESELNVIWGELRKGDLLVFYQHQTNRNGRPWMDEKKRQFERSLDPEPRVVKIAHARDIAPDVVFFFTEKP